jgi:hypothetical protein
MTSDQPPTLQYSPDGKWVWDGHNWRPVPPKLVHPTTPTPYQPTAYRPAPYQPTPYQPAPYQQTPAVFSPPQGQHAYQYQSQPGANGPPPYQQGGPARPKVDSRFAWVLAVLPLGSFALYAVLALGGLGTWPIFLIGSIALLVAQITSAVTDARRLREVGVRASTALAILVVPVYLFLRASRVGRYAIPVVWCVLSVATFIGTFALIPSFGVVVDTPLVEQSIEREILRQTGELVDVHCASFLLVKPGDGFECSGTTDAGGDFTIDITLQNDHGDIVWKVRDGRIPSGNALG